LLYTYMLAPGLAFAGPRAEPPLLLGGKAAPPERPPVFSDPRLPTGSEFGTSERPERGVLSSEPAACSARGLVCVHRSPGVTGEAALDALDALERAYEKLVFALGLPAPLADEGRGGSDALDWYLEAPDGVTEGYERVSVGADPRRIDGFDRAAGFCRALADPGVTLDRAATLCVGEAIALRLDPGETPFMRRAFATELWWITGTPTNFDFEAIDRVQSRPDLAIANAALDANAEGSALFFEYLETARSIGTPGALSTALFAAAAQSTPATADRYVNEPDVFDVLMHTLDENQKNVAELLGNFSVARAFGGEREDGQHLPGVAWAGAFGAPSFEWVIAYSSLPRRVKVGPIEPTGSAMVWVTLDGVKEGASVGLQAKWEPPAEFQWHLVRIGADGAELGRVAVPFQERASEVEGRVVELGGAAALLVIGTHLERVDPAHPFDPDVAPFEPHSAMVYLAKL
jgi:hypothetical protein